jgi:hypothetical protein
MHHQQDHNLFGKRSILQKLSRVCVLRFGLISQRPNFGALCTTLSILSAGCTTTPIFASGVVTTTMSAALAASVSDALLSQFRSYAETQIVAGELITTPTYVKILQGLKVRDVLLRDHDLLFVS